MLAVSFRGNFPYQISGLLVVIQQPDYKVKTSHVHIVHNLPIPLFYNVVNRKQKRSCVRWCEEIGRFELPWSKTTLMTYAASSIGPAQPAISHWFTSFSAHSSIFELYRLLVRHVAPYFPHPGGVKLCHWDCHVYMSCLYDMLYRHMSLLVDCHSFLERVR